MPSGVIRHSDSGSHTVSFSVTVPIRGRCGLHRPLCTAHAARTPAGHDVRGDRPLRADHPLDVTLPGAQAFRGLPPAQVVLGAELEP